eukprot:g336.t1
MPDELFRLQKEERKMEDLVPYNSRVSAAAVRGADMIGSRAMTQLDGQLSSLRHNQEQAVVNALLHKGKLGTGDAQREPGDKKRGAETNSDDEGEGGEDEAQVPGMNSQVEERMANGSKLLTPEDIENWKHRFGHFVMLREDKKMLKRHKSQRLFRHCEHLEVRPREWSRKDMDKLYARQTKVKESGEQGEGAAASGDGEQAAGGIPREAGQAPESLKQTENQRLAGDFATAEGVGESGNSLVEIWCNFADGYHSSAPAAESSSSASSFLNEPPSGPSLRPDALLDGNKIVAASDALQDVASVKWDGASRTLALIAKSGDRLLAAYEKSQIPYGLWKMDVREFAPIDLVSYYGPGRGYNFVRLQADIVQALKQLGHPRPKKRPRPATNSNTGRTNQSIMTLPLLFKSVLFIHAIK